MNTIKIKLTILCAIISTIAFSQQTFRADRPGQTISAFNMPAGSFQIEAGFNYQVALIAQDDDLDKIYTMPVMLRYGVLDFLELRLENSYKILDSHFYPTAKGLTDFKFSFKLNLRNNEYHKTNYAFIGYVTLPQDDSPLSNHKITGGLTFAVNHQWTEKFSMAYNMGIIRDSNGIFHFSNSLSASYTVSNYFSIFAETYNETFTPEYEDSRTDVNYNIGASYLLSEKFQLDAFYGRGDSIEMNSFNLGLSWRVF